MATTSERLREIIAIRNIKQVELMERTGISKGALSSYISGRYVPKQDNIYKLANALNVNPAWLMGLDVPMELPSLKVPELNVNIDTSQISKAVEMFKTYEIATPEIKAAIDSLLKTVKPIADESQKIVSQMNIPHLEVPKSKPELPRLKKDKK